MRRTEARAAWRGLEFPSLELCRLSRTRDGWQLEGSVSHVDSGGQTLIEYLVLLDRTWKTGEVHLRLMGSDGERRIVLKGDDEGRGWTVDAAAPVFTPRTDLRGCKDVDLQFSPSTNTLPIRRLSLAIGESAQVRAAWVRFPSLDVEPLEQTYARTGERSYRYRSGTFQADLEVDEAGLVIEYPGLWVRAPLG